MLGGSGHNYLGHDYVQCVDVGLLRHMHACVCACQHRCRYTTVILAPSFFSRHKLWTVMFPWISVAGPPRVVVPASLTGSGDRKPGKHNGPQLLLKKATDVHAQSLSSCRSFGRQRLSDNHSLSHLTHATPITCTHVHAHIDPHVDPRVHPHAIRLPLYDT